MKPVALLFFLCAFTALAQNKNQKPTAAHVPIQPTYPVVNPTATITSSKANVSATTSMAQSGDSPDAGHLGFTLTGTPTTTPRMVDPYRILNGRTNIVGAGWILFSGTVTGGDPNGIVLNGTYNTVPKSDEVYDGEFFVANYPNLCLMNDVIGSGTSWCYAWPAGFYDYTNATGQVRTLHKLDYGQPWIPTPPTPEQLAARQKEKADAKAAEDKKKNAITARVVQQNQESADRGEVIGLLRMGERYCDGDGVDRDLTKARQYLQRAAFQGSDTAQSELEQLK